MLSAWLGSDKYRKPFYVIDFNQLGLEQYKQKRETDTLNSETSKPIEMYPKNQHIHKTKRPMPGTNGESSY